MEIKVEEYVRTNKGLIGIAKQLHNYNVLYKSGDYIMQAREKDIVKHSFNLIDLIEVRRYSIYTRCTK